MKTETRRWLAALLAVVLVTAIPLLAVGAEIKVGQKKRGHRSFVQLEVEAPSYGPPPRGYIYGGPYVPPYPYDPSYRPYTWSPYYAPYPSYPPVPEAPREYQLIPAGRLMILTDPVSAEVSVDGVSLQRQSDLSYEVGLLEGRHRVEVRAEGYQAYDKEIKISGGRRVLLTVRLEPQ